MNTAWWPCGACTYLTSRSVSFRMFIRLLSVFTGSWGGGAAYGNWKKKKNTPFVYSNQTHAMSAWISTRCPCRFKALSRSQLTTGAPWVALRGHKGVQRRSFIVATCWTMWFLDVNVMNLGAPSEIWAWRCYKDSQLSASSAHQVLKSAETSSHHVLLVSPSIRPVPQITFTICHPYSQITSTHGKPIRARDRE